MFLLLSFLACSPVRGVFSKNKSDRVTCLVSMSFGITTKDLVRDTKTLHALAPYYPPNLIFHSFPPAPSAPAAVISGVPLDTPGIFLL